ncbi:MAG: 5-(carboxyamino)imidazole ribonucleotide mutase [Christensenella sp.]|uniref:5-(carboxyamino)imidazole ribonucleotide mutase n=1 Tax=Christensenella sp. TaxID=1935934 RepID=UPI002B1F7EF3|nr:5-(carboxyamino)imidazole ribonucleotide mutase [Christensenella sp.]MEA5002793.1 5-(carboxyamino)imidazole ribonucleotide mutase [Christensenella sp.]
MKVAVIMGSKSDLPVLKPTIDTLKDFGIEVDAHVMSAHRTPELAADFAKNAKDNGVEVIIAAAGKAAHLAGVIAGHSILPVIGLPVKSSTMDGLDSLLSTVQMPEGIPVATVAINGGKNAALLAVQILALKYDTLSDLLYKFKEDMQLKVVAADAELREEL